MPSTNFFLILPEATAREKLPDANFTLQKLPINSDQTFYFTHQSDLHLGQETEVARLYNSIARHLPRMPQNPLFVLDSGDVSVYDPEQLNYARTLFDRYPLPIFTCKGNHDAALKIDEKYRGVTLEKLFGPMYYAFTCGNYIFINLPWRIDAKNAIKWTKNLLEKLDGKFYPCVNVHHWDGVADYAPELLSLLKKHRCSGVFWGHYHNTQMVAIEGVPTFGINSGKGHIRDLGYPSFQLIKAEPNGRLTSSHRMANFEKEISLISPPASTNTTENTPTATIIRGDTLTVAANVIDTALDADTVSITITDAQNGTTLSSAKLQGGGGLVWSAQLPVATAWPAEVVLTLTVKDNNGDTWPAIERHLAVRNGDKTPPIKATTNWGALQGGIARDGACAQDLTPPLKLAWLHANRNFGLSAPVVANGRLFAGVANNIDPLAPTPVVVALDANTGEKLWEHLRPNGHSPRNTVAANDKVVVYQACDGMVVACSAENGKLLWENAVSVSHLAYAKVFLRGSPLLLGESVYAGVSQFTAAFDINTGTTLWHKTPRKGNRDFATPSLTAINDLIIMPTQNKLLGFDKSNGQQRWQVPRVGNANPVAHANKIYSIVNQDEQWAFEALSPNSGVRLWCTPLQDTKLRVSSEFGSPAANNNQVFLPIKDKLYAFDATNGALLWKIRVGKMSTPPVIAGQFLYAVTEAGKLTARTLPRGKEVWSYDLHTRVTSGLALSGNALYVTGQNGAIYAFISHP